MSESNTDADLLHGVSEIAAFLNVTKREAYYLAETGRIRVFKFNGTRKWRARRAALLEDIAKAEAEVAASTTA